jgi:prephenate dehydratase
MEKTPLYYAGTQGSFSERAAKLFMERQDLSDTDYELTPAIDPPQTLDAWVTHPESLAVVPVWSDVLGPIPTARTKMLELGWAHPDDADPEWMTHFASLHPTVRDQVSLPIHFDLLVAPGVEKKDVTRIAAYSVARAQCEEGIQRALAGQPIEFVEYPDSALAAKDLAALFQNLEAAVTIPGLLDPKHTAVLALPSSAEQFGLITAWANVQNKAQGNSTHFVLLKN